MANAKLSQWQPLLAQLPVESLVHAHQNEYYQAINQSTAHTNSAPFIEFMLARILEAIQSDGTSTQQVTPQVTPQVKFLIITLKTLNDCANRNEIQAALALKDRESFRERYLKPALLAGLTK
jgi:hypothetical protein